MDMRAIPLNESITGRHSGSKVGHASDRRQKPPRTNNPFSILPMTKKDSTHRNVIQDFQSNSEEEKPKPRDSKSYKITPAIQKTVTNLKRKNMKRQFTEESIT